jgi:low affinity Fe/Cu permease
MRERAGVSNGACRMEKYSYSFANFLSGPRGFFVTNIVTLIGLITVAALKFDEAPMIGFTLYLSIAAITITGAVLLQADRDTAAIQAKLDQLILASEATNELVGLEHNRSGEIKAVRERLEQSAQPAPEAGGK